MRRLLERIDRYQRDHLVLGFPLAVNTRFKEHNGARLAANISYYAFFSMFPLMVAFVSILGLALEDDNQLRRDLVDSAFSEIPVLGDQIENAHEPLTGSVLIVIVGILGALWAGLKMIDALTFALNEQWDVPASERPMSLLSRAKGVIVLGVFGVGMIGATVLASLPAALDIGIAGPVVGLLASGCVNVVVIGLSFVLLVARQLKPRDIWRGAVLSGFLILILQQLGVWLVNQLGGSSSTYGAFGAIIGLLAWFHLIFRVLLLSAELDVVRDFRLAPRALTPSMPNPTEGDRRALLLDIQRVKRDARVGFAVAYDGVYDDNTGDTS